MAQSFELVSQDDNPSSRGVPPRKPLTFSNRITEITDNSQYRPDSWRYYKHEPRETYVTGPQDEATEKLTNAGADYEQSTSGLTSRFSFFGTSPVSNLKIPSFAAPWQHELQGPQHKPSTVRSFSRKKQRRRIFINGLLQWSITLVIVLAQFGVLYGFSSADFLSKGQKYSFNAITTLLSLALGLAVVSALKSYAKLMSWRFLASGYHDLQDFELIMNCDSQTQVIKLFWAGRKNGSIGLNKTQLLCAISLILVIGLQITIGLLGLTYSIDSANEWYTYSYGNVSRVDLSNIYQDSTYNITRVQDQTGAANYYGMVGQSFPAYELALGKGNYGQQVIYTSDNTSSFFYNYVDMDVPDIKSTTTAVVSSDRYTRVNATCTELDIISGGYLIGNDSVTSDLTFNDLVGQQQSLRVYGQTLLTSTYITNTSDVTACGERCSQVYVLQTGYDATLNGVIADQKDISPHLYSCNSTVSEVFNPNTCEADWQCSLSDQFARYLAGSIGLSGIIIPGSSLQYRTYSAGSPLSWDGFPYDNSSVQAQAIARFATGAIAAMDSAGPRITVPGYYPVSTVGLTVEWKWAIPVLCVVPAIQMVVLMLVCIFANGALIKDSGYLAAARLLRPVVDKVGDHGCALTSDELARELGNFKIVYGVKTPAGTDTGYDSSIARDADWHVGVIAETEGYGKQAEEGWSANATFPEGRYDGRGSSISSYLSETASEDDEDVIDEKSRLL